MKYQPRLLEEFHGIKLSIDGDMKDENRFMDSLVKNFILAMLIIYCLMAVAFSSYWQPVLILTAIPFGFMGAIAGHLIMDKGISMMSMLGFFSLRRSGG